VLVAKPVDGGAYYAHPQADQEGRT
jgi:hypothetical protein